nr:hypothetical protein CFP56_05240 [Quercus suber]
MCSEEMFKRKPQKSSKTTTIDDSLVEFLQRVFGIDTIVKPLPPALAYNVSRNLNFFTRIFTQFFALQIQKVLQMPRNRLG